MKSAAATKSSSIVRYERCKPIVDYVGGRTSFGLEEVQLACRDQKPFFVTRVVNELTRPVAAPLASDRRRMLLCGGCLDGFPQKQRCRTYCAESGHAF